VDSILGGLQSPNREEVFNYLRRNAQFDDVTPGIQSALRPAGGQERSAPSTPQRDELPQGEGMDDVAMSNRLVCTTFCALSLGGAVTDSWCPEEVQLRQLALLQQPEHLITPFTIDDSSPLNRVYLDFRDAARQMAADGGEADAILGPLDTNVDLVFRNRQSTDPFTASTWACECCRIFQHVDVYTQLATAFFLSRFMRWILVPTLDNYILLPQMMRPTVAQKSIPHYAFADLCPIPAWRDSLIKGQVELSNPIDPHVRSEYSVNWPFDLEKAIDRTADNGPITVSRLFIAHVVDPKNWTYTRKVVDMFPEVVGHLITIEHRHDWNGIDFVPG